MNAYVHDYPLVPAIGRTDTSAEAAAVMAPITGRVQRAVLFAIREAGPRGLTSEEAAARLDMPHGTVQPRTSELKLLGGIEDSGQRRRNRNGKNAIVWVAVAKGGAR